MIWLEDLGAQRERLLTYFCPTERELIQWMSADLPKHRTPPPKGPETGFNNFPQLLQKQEWSKSGYSKSFGGAGQKRNESTGKLLQREMLQPVTIQHSEFPSLNTHMEIEGLMKKDKPHPPRYILLRISYPAELNWWFMYPLRHCPKFNYSLRICNWYTDPTQTHVCERNLHKGMKNWNHMLKTSTSAHLKAFNIAIFKYPMCLEW